MSYFDFHCKNAILGSVTEGKLTIRWKICRGCRKRCRSFWLRKYRARRGFRSSIPLIRSSAKKYPAGTDAVEIVREIPKAWQFSEYAYARIKYDGKEYRPANFRETRWIQKQIFETWDKKWGAIDVFYTKQFPKADEGPVPA
jgi:hypothetical protein